MLDAIKYNFGHLTDFSGRDARSTFWWWMLFLVLLNLVLGLLVSIPFTAASIGAATSAIREGATEDAVAAEVLARTAGDMKTLFYASLAVSLLVLVLFVASFVRRAHDSGRSGWWAVIPVAMQFASFVIGLQMTDRVAEAMARVRTAEDVQALEQLSQPSLASLLPWIGYLVVIVIGLLPSQPGANRFGEAPVTF